MSRYTTWHPRRSVRLRFTIVQAVFIALIIVLLAGTLYIPVRQRFVSVTSGSYETLAYTLAPSLYEAVKSGDKSAVASVVHRVDIQRGVRYVLVLDDTEKVFYDTISGSGSFEGKELPAGSKPDYNKLNRGDVQVVPSVRDGVTYYDYTVPFIVSNRPLYTVRVGIDSTLVDGEFNRLAYLFINLGAAAVLIGAIFTYLIAAKLTKPITELTESALAIRAGNLNAYPTINTNDELEQLSREFRGMVDRLKEFYFREYSQKKEAVQAKQQLQDANDRLQGLDRQKTDFMNAASHQLRTPLSVIHWSLSMIVEDAANIDMKQDYKELLSESLKSTKRMVDLVNDLLDLSRIEQGRKELSWALGNFGKVCDELSKALQPLAMNKGLELTYQQLTPIPDSFLDEKNFFQVVNNFVDNAIKYTAQGFVHLTCELQGTTILIKISDSGIGMTETERKDLFTRFSRGDEAQKMFPNGSGLGMYVARTILHQHGGKVDVESEKGKGTTFILTVPVFNQVPNPPPQLPAATPTEEAHA